MEIKRRKIKGGLERLFLIGLITNDKFINKIQSIINTSLLSNRASMQVVKMCLKYYAKYNKAPKDTINVLLDEMSEKMEPDLLESTEMLLKQLSNEFNRMEEFNCQFALDKAVEFFQHKTIEQNVEEIQDLLAKGELEEAKKLLDTSSLPSLENVDKDHYNILTEREILRVGFEEVNEPLIFFPNAFGRFVNPLLVRGGFVAFLAPEKRGKTWMLNAVALQALKGNRKVAYFNAGDMNNEEQSVRFSSMLSRKPSEKSDCGEFLVPVLDCEWNQDNTCCKPDRESKVGLSGLEILKPEDSAMAHPSYKPCRKCANHDLASFKGAVWYKKVTVEEPLTWREALRINKEFCERHNVSDKTFRMLSFPTDQLTVSKIESILEGWALEEGFVPDVVIIDYADILGTDKEYKEHRHGENSKWKRLRTITNKMNILVVTATQADGSSYEQESLTETNYSEDKRKYSHVTGILTLNQTEKESELGILRIGRFMTRRVKRTKQQVKILQCLKAGIIHNGSFFCSMDKPQQKNTEKH